MPYKKEFVFSPRPEAQAMKWDQILPPVSLAVRDLLLRLEGSIKKPVPTTDDSRQAKFNNIMANCFLIHGDRGTGKTTVMLSAIEACKREDFFDISSKKKRTKEEHNLFDDTKKSANDLKNKIIWLDVLDLEPLPPRANLLTTMLTRVRNAVYSSDSDTQPREVTSILEENADSARHKLTKLINDATLMWEDIHEQDTRSRANRQIAAADIYAHFNKRFNDAMDTLSKELGRKSGNAEAFQCIVLPIDNIDRSTDHLNSIVKLAQMVFCPRLRLVLAGDRQDVETFLERAYWKELIRIGNTAGAAGKTNVGGEDEALVMARRQAAAALHKLLPPSHRIEVGLVDPKDTLEFKPVYPNGMALSAYKKTIRDLLSEVGGTSHEANESNGTARLNFVDIFDAKRCIENATTQQEEHYITEAATLALRLPARGVLDLWQLAYWVVYDDTIKDQFEAETVALNMLRNAITESSMTSELGRYLQERVVHRSTQGGTMLEFPPPSKRNDGSVYYQLAPSYLMSPDFSYTTGYYEQESQSDQAINIPLPANLTALEFGGMSWFGACREDKEKEMLPDLVAGWLSILFDSLIWCADQSTTISAPPAQSRALVQSWHDSENLWEWNFPKWKSFTAFDINVKLWRDFRTSLKQEKLLDEAGRDQLLPRVLAIGWIASVLETAASIASKNNEQPNTGVLTTYTKNIVESLSTLRNVNVCDDQCKHTLNESIDLAELEVMEAAAKTYGEILAVNKSNGTISRSEEETWTMRDWLQWDLPYLLSHLYMPLINLGVQTRIEQILEHLNSKNYELGRFWLYRCNFVQMRYYTISDEQIKRIQEIQKTESAPAQA